MVLKRIRDKRSGSNAPSVWRWLTAKDAWLVAADVLAVWWWLDERQLMLA